MKEKETLADEALSTVFNTSPRIALLPTMTGAAPRSHIVRCDAVAHKGSVFRTVWEATPEIELGAAFSDYGNNGRVRGVWIDIRLIL
jgi:hypothetical protein